jgi:hypothetical protein
MKNAWCAKWEVRETCDFKKQLYGLVKMLFPPTDRNEERCRYGGHAHGNYLTLRRKICYHLVQHFRL